MKQPRWVGIDIGGANLKIASEQNCLSRPFELWRRADELASFMVENLRSYEPFEGLAVTMTGELADCFKSRRHGVEFICDIVELCCMGKHVVYYQTSGSFVGVGNAKRDWRLTAASNWHATAKWLADTYPDCIVIDMGSTTTDIIPVANGEVIAVGKTDFERLRSQELVYNGVARTPVPAILSSARIDGVTVGLATERFATVQDVLLWLDKTPEQEHDCNTADGRPLTKRDAKRRLAKMICLDQDEVEDELITDLAIQIFDSQLQRVGSAIREISKRTQIGKFVIIGEGAWFAKQAAKQAVPRSEITDLSASSGWASVGPALAVQQLVLATDA